MNKLDPALQAWRLLLGPARVLTSPADLEPYMASTSASPVAPLAVLRPLSHGEVVAVVRSAGEFDIPLYPLSTGRNWGYGDANPSREGQVIVDLGGMNRIIEIDPELAYAVIEPGVTQAQLAARLGELRLPLWMDCTGAGPDTSLVGNILERGFGHTPYGNRMLHVAGMRIVLASGDTLETGFAHFAHATAAHLYPYGVGPWLDGLFTQSNFGIVTSLGFWLLPQTASVSHLVASVSQFEGIAPVVDALRPLRMDGTLSSVVHIGNDLRVLSGGMVFPAALVPQGPPLPQQLRADFCRSAGIGAWTVSAALYGRPAQLADARRALRTAIGKLATLRFIDDRALAIGSVAARLMGRASLGAKLSAQVDLGRSLLNMNRGIPDGRFLAGAYWRRRGGLPPGFPFAANPARDGCGMMWLAPVLPMRGVDLLRVHALVAPLFAMHGFDLFETFSMINERVLGGVLTICFDQEDAAEVLRARQCYEASFARLMGAGYIPYRVGPQSFKALDSGHDTYWSTVARIKAALDPQHIIAPGRYQPR
ncbi:4-cresol dehydrogenase (hydroxylating) [Duganella sp. CF458]|uniref:FAD-binding oxidoreductase n=1 Tax=Duganella sp. CF458 TaxID=1884368 RepID=UPI0008EA6258|nr:FAD-binding oxidoreductase [Duganella sp. CF458]SFG70144.1 4-cresol dehydrogenase (hydroxylating) [Duganella sp. CF458]